MKKAIKIILVTFVFVVFGCDDFVDIDPKGQENTENFFNSADDYESALIGVYDLLSTTYLNNILGEIASDNSLCGGENPTDVLDWQQIDDMSHNPDNGAVRDVFKWMYAGISRANYILEFQNKTDFDRKPQVLAETKFLRAYYYFELVKFFGDVPMYLDKRISVAESQTIDKSTKEQVYTQLEKDLIEVAAVLPWMQAQEGRATKGAALALLGKIYLYQEKFSQAAQTLDQVINSGQYTLLSNFESIFSNLNENNSESVFEVQYFGQEGASFDCFVCVEGNIAVGFMGPRFTGGNYAPYSDGFSFNIPTLAIVNAYETGDTRRDATFLDINAFVTGTDITFATGHDHNGYFNKKYIPYAEGNASDPHLTHSNNYRAIRFSDVLLMAAEAYNRGGINDAIARDYVNRVRRRAFNVSDTSRDITSSGTTLTDDIYNERRLELAGEGHRFFDQVRTANTATIPGYEAKNSVFPLPRIEIELAGNRWEQNTGY
ncbi:RagB/SusD family nutrient uptake outer membrane protein [Tenacibaculum sp. M341]|uniref:RagB/SusD family nutrient uptake outer membrane protein n=1 Tax=Tenacibaculum sp. M341 TaxID=2530339 RepID=UPI00104D928A|nr:RagB/SusD family nutrient uptake outer membrane protein [Tenacibaculum sp. M341]TCI90653.1 RagB/SusD family nutrient uptake outer membrane protein [Tenacibaculum sp. M341]